MAGRRGRQSGTEGSARRSARCLFASLASLTLALLSGTAQPALAANADDAKIYRRSRRLLDEIGIRFGYRQGLGIGLRGMARDRQAAQCGNESGIRASPDEFAAIQIRTFVLHDG